MSRLVSFFTPEPCFASMREEVVRRSAGKVYDEEKYFDPASIYYVLNPNRDEQIAAFEESDEALRQAAAAGLTAPKHFGERWALMSGLEQWHWHDKFDELKGEGDYAPGAAH